MTVQDLINKLTALPEQYKNYQIGYITGDEFGTWTNIIENIDPNIFESADDIISYNTEQKTLFTDYPLDATQVVLIE